MVFNNFVTYRMRAREHKTKIMSQQSKKKNNKHAYIFIMKSKNSTDSQGDIVNFDLNCINNTRVAFRISSFRSLSKKQ